MSLISGSLCGRRSRTSPNLLMSITAITTTFICIVVLGVAWLVSAHVGGVTSSVRQDVSVEAYFPPDATQEEIDSIISDVKLAEVSGVSHLRGGGARSFQGDLRGQAGALREPGPRRPASVDPDPAGGPQRGRGCGSEARAGTGVH